MTIKWITGPKGGQYYVNESGKKVYKKKESNRMDNSGRHTPNQKTRRNNADDVSSKKVKHCCCCGKELDESESRYYDLTDYCPRCALADGIIESLE